ncbi:MAG TPA: DUF3810 family protein [Trueperaceae bacterium]|nr:DUF3810 family protein [Trueperaceae bacterium]
MVDGRRSGLRRTPGLSYWLAAAVALVGIAVQFIPWPAAWIDRVYVARWLPLWQRAAAALSGDLTFSLSYVLVGLSLSVLAAGTVTTLVAPRRAARGSSSPWRPLLALVAWIVAVLVGWFPFGFGLAYHASSLSAAVGAISPSDLDRAVAWSLGELNAAAALTSTTTAGADGAQAGLPPHEAQAAASRCVATAALSVREAFLPATVLAQGAPPTLPTRVKPLPPGTLLRFGYAGIVSPWLLEPHVDAGLPPTSGLAVALHELAHVAGFAQEAEAEAIGLLAGLTCDASVVRYAAAFHLASSVAAGMSQAERATYVGAWPERAVADARAAATASARYEIKALRSSANVVYDAYLRAQGGADGLREYDRGTLLGLALLLKLGVVSGAGSDVGEADLHSGLP